MIENRLNLSFFTGAPNKRFKQDRLILYYLVSLYSAPNGPLYFTLENMENRQKIYRYALGEE
jgi:hypothetical protein